MANRTKFCRATERAIIEQLAYEHQINLIYFDDKDISGYFEWPNTIAISSKSRHPLEVYFHELGHYHCFRNHIWPAYHRSVRRPGMYTKQAVLSTAFRAEKWVDKWAERECLSYFPNYYWNGSYRTDVDREWLNNYYNDDKVYDSWYA